MGSGGGHGLLAGLHCFDDILVARATAQIAFQQFTDFAFRGFRVVCDQIDCTHHHPGGAKAALQAVAFFERGLHRVHGAVGLGQAFNGGDVGTTGLGGQNIARFNGAPVHLYRAGPALGGIAADMGAGEFEGFAQGLYQERVGGEVKAVRLAIDFELNLHKLRLHRWVKLNG